MRQISIAISPTAPPEYEVIAQQVLDDSLVLDAISVLPNGTTINDNDTIFYTPGAFGSSPNSHMIISDSDDQKISFRAQYTEVPAFEDLKNVLIYAAFTPSKDLDKNPLPANPTTPSSGLGLLDTPFFLSSFFPQIRTLALLGIAWWILPSVIGLLSSIISRNK